jgi:tight adherence protein B
MRRVAALIAIALLTACFAASAALAASMSVRPGHGVVFPARVLILNLSARMTLTSSQISVSEAGQPVTGVSVATASSAHESHSGVVLLIDTNSTMRGAAINNAVKAARSFIAARNPSQPMAIATFDETTQVIAPMTTNANALQAAVATVPSLHSGSRIFDAGNAALQILTRARQSGGSVVLLSNRGDTGSSITQEALAQAALNQSVQIYTVGLRYPRVFRGRTLQELAGLTNGYYTLSDSPGLANVYRGLGIALSNEYLIHYQSAAPLGSKVPVEVRVTGVGSASTSYTAPTLAPGVSLRPSRINNSSFWTSAAGSLLITIACAALIGLAVLLLLTKREGVRTRIGSFVSTLGIGNAAPSRTLVQRALGDPGRRRVSSPWFVRLAEDLEIARIRVAPIQLVAITAVGMLLLAVALLTATSSVLGALLALAFPFLVIFGIRYLATRQRRLFDEQLPDNLTVIASALRAGHTFAGALRLMLEDAPEPTRRELGRAMADEALGVPLADSLGAVSDRMRSLDFQQVTLVATLQRDTGGNTAEVIDVVTETVRDRLDLRRLVRSLTSQGRLAGGILSVMPVVILIIVSLINPQYTHPLFHSFTGIVFLIIGGVLILSGATIIRRIVNIEI